MIKLDDDKCFMMSMLLSSEVDQHQIDKETTKLANDNFDIYVKDNNLPILIVDKRNPKCKKFYNDIETAYEKVFGMQTS